MGRSCWICASGSASCQRNEESAWKSFLATEAGYDGFWLHRLLEAHGVRKYVIDPAESDQVECEGYI